MHFFVEKFAYIKLIYYLCSVLKITNMNWKIKRGEFFPKLDKIREGLYMTTSNDKYLSDYIEELPENCLFDKGKTGCGGTTIALESPEPYVIAVPYKKLMENKKTQYPDLITVDGTVSVDDLFSNFLQINILNKGKNAKNWKVMTTFDSLHKVNEVLTQLGLINQTRLLVDEIHTLFCCYKLRGKAKDVIIASKSLYKSFCFMTATNDENFVPSWLKDVPVVKIYWNMMSEKPSEVKYVKTNSVADWTFQKIVSLLSIYKESDEKNAKNWKNLYFFVNSVKLINQICKKLEIPREMVRCIYSDTNNECDYPCNSPLDPVKPINFITSTAFEGSDFYDKNAEVYVLVSGMRINTIIDLDLTLKQILGRVRDVSKNSVTLVFDEISGNEICKKLESEYLEEVKICELYNQLSKKLQIFDLEKSRYIVQKNGKAEIDEDAYLYDCYKATLLEKYRNVPFTEENVDKTKPVLKTSHKSFQQTLREYENASNYERAFMMLQDEFLAKAVNKLGLERVSALRTKQKIKICLDWCGEKDLAYCIAKTLDLKEGQFYSSEVIKSKLSDIKSVAGSIPSNYLVKLGDFYEVRAAKRGGKNGYIIEYRRFS